MSTNPFDPLTDIVGLERDDSSAVATPDATPGGMASKHARTPHRSDRAVHMRPTAEQSTDDRVAAAKSFVKGGAATSHGNAQVEHSFGVTGANRHATLHPHLAQQQQQHYQQQQQQQQAMMQMQAYSTYNAMAMYNTAAYYTQQAQNAQQMQMHGAVVPYGQAQAQGQFQAHAHGALVPYGQQHGQVMDAAKIAPAMEAQSRRTIGKTEYRVQRRRAENEAVSEDDKAFKPLLEELKASFAGK